LRKPTLATLAQRVYPYSAASSEGAQPEAPYSRDSAIAASIHRGMIKAGLLAPTRFLDAETTTWMIEGFNEQLAKEGYAVIRISND